MFNVALSKVGTGYENLTLNESELECCQPIRTQGGQRLRAFCPFHGSDHQRSLAIDIGTGRFHCFACGAWGYMVWAREEWRKERDNSEQGRSIRRTHIQEDALPQADLVEVWRSYQAALPCSPGAEYIRLRGIPLELAQLYGLGYAQCGKWIHRAREWKWGRIVVPHTDPNGRLISLYGRAIGPNESVPKKFRHDHLPGAKGYFNAMALRRSDPLFVTEGPFDALSLIAIGQTCVTAIFGVCGWRWDWARDVRSLVLALDSDTAGQRSWRSLARQARLRGREVFYLSPTAYGGRKDANEALIAGLLNVAV